MMRLQMVLAKILLLVLLWRKIMREYWRIEPVTVLWLGLVAGVLHIDVLVAVPIALAAGIVREIVR